MVVFRRTDEACYVLAVWVGASFVVPLMVRSIMMDPASRRTASVSMIGGVLASVAGLGFAAAEMNRAALIGLSIALAVNLLGAGFAYAAEETRRTHFE